MQELIYVNGLLTGRYECRYFSGYRDYTDVKEVWVPDEIKDVSQIDVLIFSTEGRLLDRFEWTSGEPYRSKKEHEQGGRWFRLSVW